MRFGTCYLKLELKVIPALVVQNLNFSYGQRCVLKDVSFFVSTGRLYGLLGPNGSGKTTLLKCINGIMKPKSGRVICGGTIIEKLDRKEIARKISVVPQQVSIIFPFKVEDIVVMGRAPSLGLWETPKAADRSAAVKLLQELGIEHLAGRHFNEISGGERQMVLLARALFQDTEIMLLDEPTNNLDYRNQVLVLDLIKKIALKRKITVVMTLHDPNLALHYCDEVILLKNECVVAQGKVEEVLTDENLLSSIYKIDIRVEVMKKGNQVIMPRSWQLKDSSFKTNSPEKEGIVS